MVGANSGLGIASWKVMQHQSSEEKRICSKQGRHEGGRVEQPPEASRLHWMCSDSLIMHPLDAGHVQQILKQLNRRREQL